MEQHSFYTNINTAKQEFGRFRDKVSDAKLWSSPAYGTSLFLEITQIIILLTESQPFFRSIGKKWQADVLIIGYQSLQAGLNSS